MNEFESDILGFDPSQLDVFNQQEGNKSAGNPLIYKTRPIDSKSEDHVYRATIKPVYNPFNFKASILEQQSYAIQDENGWLVLVSSLTNNDTSCPIFKAWKKCHYAEQGSDLWKQAAKADEGGKALFDKRFGRYITIQIIEDDNRPDLVGKYMFWKLPKSIWELINSKMTPKPESKKPRIPIMDFLFGRAIELEVSPGPGKPGDERYSRETSYAGEITDEVVSCTNPDGSPLLDDSEQEVLDTYVEAMKKVWKEKDPDTRLQKEKDVANDPNTAELKKIYPKVIATIKTFCPNLVEALGYKEWSDEQKSRVNKWIEAVLNLQDPAQSKPSAVSSIETPTTTTTTTESVDATDMGFNDTDDSSGDDLPF